MQYWSQLERTPNSTPRFGGKKSAIEMDSSIWREKIGYSYQFIMEILDTFSR